MSRPQKSSPIIHIPRGARVFLLEDNEERAAWFRARVSELYWVTTADEAIAALQTMGPFDWLFLDHDLGIITEGYSCPPPPEGNGEMVARYLAEHGYLGHHVLIHSWNTAAALRMKGWLRLAAVIPFGSFNIVEYDAATMEIELD